MCLLCSFVITCVVMGMAVPGVSGPFPASAVLSVPVAVCVCVSLCVFVWPCECVYLCVLVAVCVSGPVSVCLWPCECVSVCPGGCVCQSVHVCACICMYPVCVCMCLYMFAPTAQNSTCLFTTRRDTAAACVSTRALVGTGLPWSLSLVPLEAKVG